MNCIRKLEPNEIGQNWNRKQYSLANTNSIDPFLKLVACAIKLSWIAIYFLLEHRQKFELVWTYQVQYRCSGSQTLTTMTWLCFDSSFNCFFLSSERLLFMMFIGNVVINLPQLGNIFENRLVNYFELNGCTINNELMYKI